MTRTNPIKKTTLALVCFAALGGVSIPVAADNYYVVVPSSQGGQHDPNINVLLNSFPLSDATVGQSYAGFDFNQALSVTGDPEFNSAGVTWSIVAGALPSGITLGADGTLKGITAQEGRYSFTVGASYKGVLADQSYSLNVEEPLALRIKDNFYSFDAVATAYVGEPYYVDIKDHIEIIDPPEGFDVGDLEWVMEWGGVGPGLTANSEGIISGTPTEIYNGAISYIAYYRGKSVGGFRDTVVYSAGPWQIALTSNGLGRTFPNMQLGQPYSVDLLDVIRIIRPENLPADYDETRLVFRLRDNQTISGLSITGTILSGVPTRADGKTGHAYISLEDTYYKGVKVGLAGYGGVTTY